MTVALKWEIFHHNNASVMPVLRCSQMGALIYLGYHRAKLKNYLKFCLAFSATIPLFGCKFFVFSSHNLAFDILRLRQSFDRTVVIFEKQSYNSDIYLQKL